MNQRRHVTLVAAAATLLATAPLSTVFEAWTWSVDCLFVVAAICAAALGTRAVRAPLWAQLLAMFGALVVMVTWLFGKGALLGTIPTGTTLTHYGDLLVSAGHDISDYGVPVPDRDGLLFLTAMSVGLVAILVDLVAVSLRRPALAGFPMLAMYWIPVLVHPDSVSLVPFVVGAVGFLWLLVTDNVDRVRRFGRRFTGEGRDVDVWEPSPLAAAGRRLAVVGVVLAVLLPLAVPGMTNGLLDRFGTNGGSGGIGSPGGRDGGATVDLFSALNGQLRAEKQIDMVKVTTSDPSPGYLRFGVADRISGSGFSARPPADGRTATGPLPNATIPGVPHFTGSAKVQILNLTMQLLPVYAQPEKINGLDGSWLYDQGSGLVYSNRQYSTGKTYTFDYVRSDYTAAALRNAKPLSDTDEVQRLDAQVIDVPQVDAKVQELTKGKTTQYDKVRALYDYFSAANGFLYALTTKTGTTGSDIADFLEKKQGYCEQYASALAWLVRAAGYPARVAFGFTKGSNRDKDTYTLTNLNLHAWTEVYFQGFGWVPFDATPTSAIAGPLVPAYAPDLNRSDSSGSSGTPGGINPSAGAGGDVTGKNPGDGEGSSSLGGGGRSGSGPIWFYWTFGSIALVLLLLAMPAARRASVRRRRRPRALHAMAVVPPQDDGPVEVTGQMRVVDSSGDLEAARGDAHAAWDELVDTLVDYRIPLDESETPRVTADRIATMLRLRPEAADGVRRLGQAEERARYAKVPLPSGGLSGALRTVRAAIAGRATRWTRVRAVLLPPSVLRRWSAGLVEGVSGTVAAVGRRRDALFRAIRPRRFLLVGRSNRS